MDRTLRTILVVLGVACFVAGAGSAFGWWSASATGFAFAGFAFWLASTLP